MLNKEQSTLYTYLDEVWTVRNSHIVNELPPPPKTRLYFYHATKTTAVISFVERVNQKTTDFGMRMALPWQIFHSPFLTINDHGAVTTVLNASLFVVGISFPQKINLDMWQNTEQETVSFLHQVKLSSASAIKEQGRAS